MPTFTVTETRPSTTTYYYTVDALSEEEAINRILSGNIPPYTHDTNIDWDGESEYDAMED